MAQGWGQHFLGALTSVHSAGITTHGLNPHAVAVMAEAGIDITSHYSKTLDDLDDITFDWVVTVCDHAHETCPILPEATHVIHHSFDDPPKLAADETDPQQALEHYRRVRDEIRDFVRDALPGLISQKDSS